MSTLQISLAVIGVLVLVCVIAYNVWIVRKNAPRTARPPGAAPARTDTDLAAAAKPQSGRIEPVLDASLSPAASAWRAPTAAALPVLLNTVLQPADKKQALDVLIDVIAPLQLEAPVSGDALLAALPGTRRVGSKPFALEAQNQASGEWESPRAGQRYRALQAGVQLANRTGALNDIEFSEFIVKTQAFADAVGAAPDFPDMRAEVGRARELDAFASSHDAQLRFTVRARSAAWSPGYVVQHAARLGFVAGSLPGRMVVPGSQSGQAPLLSLSLDPQAAMAEEPEHSALREITLALEVTHVARSEQAFVRLRQSAAALAQEMDGVVTDDAGQALSNDAMDLIGADLEALYDALDRRDLCAGSPQARRLFS
ncbi:cell division protein ZipA C-terminal FtsZ-binding domain-containing protein [Hydrogenophaga sp.]|uniref:cell division protein ZipA C-terminal FtsZ-binding domain-containing protein n=1 Tax=Hydrogenophaga sp. TaxID=1904254 RepID=UPI001989D6B8|nr:cell division protein ZipA C-terminal FtsZ-binding domain-containing protein [Hydrogenophaga sp.]MBD3893642.1 cell division protein FtsZ [Hydrogenophaga sp.]